jgi:NTE family protein
VNKIRGKEQEKSHHRPPRRALVLGCGGVAGAAWSIARLHRLQQHLDWDPRDADILVGTSAGAVLATLLASGVSVDALLACQQGRNNHSIWDHDRDTGGALPPIPALRFTGTGLALKGLKGKVSPLTALCGLLPRGTFDMTPFRNLINSAVKDRHWPEHPATWIMAVDNESGRRVPFGRGGAPRAHIADAVCASYGVPGWCPPVEIGGRTYIDGGVASPTSADMVVDSAVEEVIVLAPMASSRPDRPGSLPQRLERGMRRYMTAIVNREEALLKRAGKKVLRIEPEANDLRAIGYNMMDPARRESVLTAAMAR